MKFLDNHIIGAGKRRMGEKGVAIILVVGALVFFLVFFLIFLDFAYVYFVRGQLHNAADAAALAGVAEVVIGPCSNSQTKAINEAAFFAGKNTAGGGTPAGRAVSLDTTPGATGTYTDIIFGNWNRANSPPFTPCPDAAAVNAIQVTARRTQNYPTGEFGLVFGKIFNTPTMGVGAVAIAARPPKAEAPIAVCLDSCSLVIPVSGLLMYWAPYPDEIDPGTQGIAWTIFDPDSQSTPTKDIADYFCGKENPACGLSVYSSNGANNAAAKQFRCAFKNPLYDSVNKTCSDGACDNISDDVTSWKVIVPIFESAGCPPGAQPDPYEIVGYARITVTEVYASGGGGTNLCACAAYSPPAMGGPTPNAIKITAIECVDCPEASTELLGRRPMLVE